MLYGLIYLAGLCLLLGIGSGESYYGKPIKSPWNQYVDINRGRLGTYMVYEFSHNGHSYKIYPYKIKFSDKFALDPRTSTGFSQEISSLKLTNNIESNRQMIINHFCKKFNLKLQII